MTVVTPPIARGRRLAVGLFAAAVVGTICSLGALAVYGLVTFSG
ncbi:hypothetical protein ACIQU1_03270 [Streptomyces angustmyceticus]